MDRSPNTQLFNDWFTNAVQSPLETALGRSDIATGRQFAGGGSFMGTDRERQDALARTDFYKQLAGARSQAALSNEDLRLRAAGQVSGLRTPEQIMGQQGDVLTNLIQGQDIQRQQQKEQIAMELQNYLRNLDYQKMWMDYNLAPLQYMPNVAGEREYTSGLFGGPSGGGGGGGGGGGMDMMSMLAMFA